jgi:segregation and condensation protein B
MLEEKKLQALIEAVLFAAGKPLSEDEILQVFTETERPSKAALRQALHMIQADCVERGVTLIEIASGFQFQVKSDFIPWVSKLWEEKSARYSRALLETLALIAYRQPVTRGEIEDIRGVSLSPSIFKTLLDEREWIRVVGHRDVPGRPALYATTKNFLDYFGLKSLEDLPSLPEVLSLGAEEAEKMLVETFTPSLLKQLDLIEENEALEVLQEQDIIEVDELIEIGNESFTEGTFNSTTPLEFAPVMESLEVDIEFEIESEIEEITHMNDMIKQTPGSDALEENQAIHLMSEDYLENCESVDG